MRSASDCIWFTVADNQTTSKSNKLEHTERSRPHDQPSNQGSGHLHQHYTRPPTKPDWIDGYVRMVTDRVGNGWSFYMVTILFSQLPGSRQAILHRMTDEVIRVYSTFVTRVHRYPRAASVDEIPIAIGAFDLPVYKRDLTSAPTVLCNGGLHFHALVLMPPSSRLKGSLVDHFLEKRDLYVRPGKPVQRIHVEPVTHDHDRVVDYVFKTIGRHRLSYDEAVLVLPRSPSELEGG
jgi:hypothetical protein